MYSSIAHSIYKFSIDNPEKLAIADTSGCYNYRELACTFVNTYGKMLEMGIKSGDYILVECTQNADFIILDLACQCLGAVFVPVEKKALADRVKKIYSEAKAVCIFSETDYPELGSNIKIREFIGEKSNETDIEFPRINKNALAEILFSTGTTGEPKGICISNRANIAIAENIIYGTKMNEKTVEMIPLPLSHSHGLRTCYANLYNGSSIVIIDGVMNVGLFFKMLGKYNVNALDVSPTLAKLLLKIAKKGLQECSSSIDYIEIGTAVLEDDTKEKLKNIFVSSRLYNFYGSTEAGRSCVLNFNEIDFASCIGYPSKNSTFYIVDEERHVIESSVHNTGIIAVSGPMMMDGYFNAEQLTKDTVVDGILYTSDVGYFDEDGRLYVIGRKDDVINYKGIKIAPEEIESVAVLYDAVSDCACVPMTDSVCGQVPMLFIKVKNQEQFDLSDYNDFLKKNLDISRMPKKIEIIEEIPRSSNGKLQRKKLLEKQ